MREIKRKKLKKLNKRLCTSGKAKDAINPREPKLWRPFLESTDLDQSKEDNFEESKESQPDNNKWEVAKNESENETGVEQKIKQLL